MIIASPTTEASLPTDELVEGKSLLMMLTQVYNTISDFAGDGISFQDFQNILVDRMPVTQTPTVTHAIQTICLRDIEQTSLHILYKNSEGEEGLTTGVVVSGSVNWSTYIWHRVHYPDQHEFGNIDLQMITIWVLSPKGTFIIERNCNECVIQWRCDSYHQEEPQSPEAVMLQMTL
jgi:hypothetical protein